MSLKASFELMADYNQWMNKNIYDAASQLSVTELAEDRGAFFGSIMNTLNHILVGDTLWLKRFAEHSSRLTSLNDLRSLQRPASLDTVLYANFEELSSARKNMDEVIQAFAHELTDEVLLSSLSYHSTTGEFSTKNLGFLVQHFFNHQTHHRGQVSTLLSQRGIDIGVTDLLLGIPNA